VIECVVNVSEGADLEVLARLESAGSPDVLDIHRDPHHHRSVMTLVGTDAPRRVAAAAIAALDIGRHQGVHPRLGAVDVVPFVDLDDPHRVTAAAVEARDAFAAWVAAEWQVPCFLYGPVPGRGAASGPTLPEIRRRAFVDLAPDVGPTDPHPTAGAICVGARPVLVAFNVWLPRTVGLDDLRRLAADVRRPGIRTLGLLVGGRPQLSMNLVEPWRVTPADAYDAVAAHAPAAPEGCELVGLVPEEVLAAIHPDRWDDLDLSPDRTIEARQRRRQA
jgi:glutamate formiminotransferase / 5-formyltetrahydrofolate cyclo-ligase